MPGTRQVLQMGHMACVRDWDNLESVLHVEGLVSRSDWFPGTVLPDHSCFKEPRISSSWGTCSVFKCWELIQIANKRFMGHTVFVMWIPLIIFSLLKPCKDETSDRGYQAAQILWNWTIGHCHFHNSKKKKIWPTTSNFLWFSLIVSSSKILRLIVCAVRNNVQVRWNRRIAESEF